MLDNADDYCKIITTDDAARKISLNALLFVNIEKSIAEKLMTEPFLEVRKFKSNKPQMDNCAVVKCSDGTMWNIPHVILERAMKV